MWPFVDRKGPKWTGVTRSDPEWPKEAQIGARVAKSGPERRKRTREDLKCAKVAQDGQE